MRNKRIFLILIFLTVVTSCLYLFYGLNPNSFQFALSRRIPNFIAIIITGSSVAFSTVIFQTVTNNRILTPSVLGLDSLYSLIQTGIVFVLGAYRVVEFGSYENFFLSGILMVCFSVLLFRVMFRKEQQNLFFLLMIGMVFGTLFGSLSSFMQRIMDTANFLLVQNRTITSFNNVQQSLIGISLITLLLTIIWIWRDLKYLDVLSLGREHAINLGMNYQRLVRKLLIVVAIMVSVSTALVGPITFLGLLVVNLAYQLFHDYRHKTMIFGAILISIIALVGGQFLVERVFQFGTTVGVIINFIGGIYFIYILLREAKL